MSQHDFNIANQTFPSFRSDLNDALQAAATISAGATAPTTPYAYQLWYDTANEKYMIRNAANSAWLNFVGIDTNGNVDVTGTVTAHTLEVGDGSAGGTSEVVFSDNVSGRAKILYDHGASPEEMGFEVAGTRYLTIENGGNVGIGTSPSDILHIKDSASTNVLIDAPTDNASLTLQCGSSDAGAEGAFIQFIQNTTAKWQLGMNTDNTFRLYNYNTSSEAMQIDSSGKLFKGRTTTFGGANIANEGAEFSAIGNAVLGIGRGSADLGACVRFFSVPTSGTGTIVGSISITGSSTAYNTSSDYRLKENVVADWDATTRLKQLNPVRFNFIADADTTVDGFLAHEVQTVVPEAITGTHNGMRDEEYEVSAATGDIYTPAIEAVLDEDGNEVTPAVAEVIHSTDVERPEELAEGQQWRETTAAVMGTRSVPNYQGIDQSKLVPLLVKTIQELEARITALEAN